MVYRYICAAIWLTSSKIWDRSIFQTALKSAGNEPLLLTVISLLVGILLLILSEFGRNIKNSFKDMKRNWNEFNKQ
jgi:uncharacterized membrane protein YdcZ (DUF606 family)